MERPRRGVTTFVLAALSAACGNREDAVRTPTVSGPVTNGQGVSLVGTNVERLGYAQEEYFIEGTAARYQPTGALSSDGRWTVTETETSAYKTRLVVWRPRDPAAFNGTVVVEWLNVSAGFDSAVDWLNAHNYLVRKGATWVGVSAQAVGVQGGVSPLRNPDAPPAGGLKAADPVRYGSLLHPGDAYSYDIYSQAGEAPPSSASKPGSRPVAHRRRTRGSKRPGRLRPRRSCGTSTASPVVGSVPRSSSFRSP